MRVFSILLVVIFVGCTAYSRSFEKKIELQEKINVPTKKMGLTLAGLGGSSTADNIITCIDSTYALYETADIAKARRLLVQVVLKSVEIANNDPTMAEYVAALPIASDLFCISIVFAEYGLHAYTSADNSLSGVTLANGKVFYDQEDAETEQYTDLLVETFEEALAIVRSEQDSEAY